MTGNITTWKGHSPYWNDPTNWTNGVPDEDTIAVVANSAASADEEVTVKELRLEGTGRVNLADVVAEKLRIADDAEFYASTVIVSQEFRFTGGIAGAHIDIPQDATVKIEGTNKKEINGRLRVRGKGLLDFTGHHLNLYNEGLEIDITGVLEVRAAAPLDGAAPVTNYGRLEIAAPMRLVKGVHLKNSDLGTLQIMIPDQTAAQSPRITLERDNSFYLDGKLVLALKFEPPVGASVQVLSYPQWHCDGKFTAIESCPDPWQWQANYGATGLSVQRVT